MKLWKAFVGLIGVIGYLPLALALSQSPVGDWTTIDDKTGEKRAVVNLSLSGDTLNGTIINIYSQPGDTGICTNCPDGFKDKKTIGLQFLWGLKKQSDNVWSGGSILDPKTGKIYRAKITLEGNKLYVRGYIGVSLLGRTQIWVK
jgi:uncharacterized protein (DUF2147 family)